VGGVDGLLAGGSSLEGVAVVVGLGEGRILEAERFDDLFAVQITNGFAGHLL
jgi:hypothetical protein